MSLADQHDTGMEFHIHLTNDAVWVLYEKDPLNRAIVGAEYDAFKVYRRLASRKSADEVVDIRIEIDRTQQQQQVRCYVDNELLRVVKNLGKLTNELFANDNDESGKEGRRRARLVAFSP